ncbi:hypothetical protein BJ912DRAFT_1037738 [Pholiota molesta]|nr:hypothetical protein BJ912DRAFT_1037738 [Pholiota molesta]
MATETPTLPCLYIPDDSSPNQAVEEKTLLFPGSLGFDDVVCKLLECRRRGAEMIYSEDELAKINGGEDGVRPGRRFAMYEAYMDGNARHGTRAYNTRAARLLALPQSYGPIIVVKMTCTKSFMGGVQDVVKVPLTQAELQSLAFQRRRQEYSVKKEDGGRFGNFWASSS